MRREIGEMLKEYTGRDLAPWHMPGHKRKNAFGGMWDVIFPLDVTEVPGTDDLHHATGAILHSEQAAADAVGAAYAHYLVGGSTAGILSAVSAAAKLWRESGSNELAGAETPVFLVASNCHKSVWNGLRLAGAEVIPLEPKGDSVYGPVQPEELLRALSEYAGNLKKIAGCIITSPTYGGSMSQLSELHKVLEMYKIPMIVDQAHGAHLAFCSELASFSGTSCGAEYVIASLHKTIPAMTQTAVLYVGGKKEDKETQRREEAIAGQLAIFQTSSPSYILMLSAEEAVAWADENRMRFDTYIRRMKSFREELEAELRMLRFVPLEGEQEPTRLMLQAKGWFTEKKDAPACPEGTYMASWLEQETGVVAELAGSREIILLSSVMDDEEDLDRLKQALLQLDKHLREDFPVGKKEVLEGKQLPGIGETVQRDIYVYPPGVPILRSGEKVTEAALEKLREEQNAGRKIYGLG